MPRAWRVRMASHPHRELVRPKSVYSKEPVAVGWIKVEGRPEVRFAEPLLEPLYLPV